MMRNHALCGQGFPVICHIPCFDNVALIDSAVNVALFCEDLGVHGTQPSVLAIL